MHQGPESMDPQRRNELEEEMSRFELEIAGHQLAPPMISANTFQMAAEQIQSTMHGAHGPLVANHMQPRPGPGMLPGQGPDSMMNQPPHAGGPGMMPNMGQGNVNGPAMGIQNNPSGLLPTPHHQIRNQRFGSGPPTMPAFRNQMQMSRMPLAPPPMPPIPPQMQMMGMHMPSTSRTATTAAGPTMTSEEKKEWESTYSQAESEAGKDKKKDSKKKFIRVAGGTAWEDSSLADWDPNDFRVFVGDLGNEVNDDTLTRVFSKYPSFLKAKVLRDRKTNKTKGYGFVSFKDPNDFIKAMREMNGKYIGNRPCKLRKSSWKDRNIDVVKKKQREKKKLGLL